MKESGIDWIGQIPEEWELGRVKDFYKFFTGFTPDTSRVEYYGDINDFVWVTIADMTSKKIESSKQTLSDIFIKEKRPQVSRLGSLLYSFKLSVGKVAFANTDLYTNEAIATFEDGPNINLRFLYYSSYLIEFNSETNIYGAKLLNSDRIRNAYIVQPSLSEQTKIADFLDKKTTQLDKVKSLLEEQIQKLKDYRASLIYETVTKGLDKTAPLKDSGIDWIGEVPEGWGVKAIKYIFDEIGSGSTPKSDNEIFYDGDINWIQSGDLYQTDTVTSVSKTISYQGFKSTSALKIYQPPFVALAMYGASVGNVAVSYIDACVNQAVVVMLGSSEKVGFGKYAIEASKSNLIFSAQGGTQPNISQNLIKNWSIPQPKSEEQDQIVDFLDNETSRIDKLIQIKNQQIENINKQRQTLIYDYVTGKRRV